MSNPRLDRWHASKNVAAYISSIVDVGLTFGDKILKPNLVGFVDVVFTSDINFRKSTTAYDFLFVKNCIYWKSGLQPLVMLSTTKS